MQPTDDRSRPVAQFAAFLQRNCLWLLIGCYAIAAVMPGPGLAMRDWPWGGQSTPNAAVTLPLLLLTLLLFCAALQTDVAQIRSVATRPWALLAGVVAVWLGPALLVVGAAATIPWLIDEQHAASLLVGLALIASMPVANSSVGWTQIVHGNLALGLALVLVTIFLCPWVTPALLDALQMSLSADARAKLQLLVDNFSGTFFIAWVIAPTLVGLVCRFVLGERRVLSWGPWTSIASVAALLLLNYVNASLAMPAVFQHPPIATLFVTAALAIMLSIAGMAAGWLVAWWLRLATDERDALLFGLSMKHTGLALLLAGAMLPSQPLVILMIVLATLAQHLAAGVIEWRLQPRS